MLALQPLTCLPLYLAWYYIFNWPVHSDQPGNEISFPLPLMKSNVNIIFFMVQPNLISNITKTPS